MSKPALCLPNARILVKVVRIKFLQLVCFLFTSSMSLNFCKSMPDMMFIDDLLLSIALMSLVEFLFPKRDDCLGAIMLGLLLRFERLGEF